MKVIAWNNGDYSPTGAGYGLRLDPSDRDRIFDRSWKEVKLDVPTGAKSVAIKLAPSFWRDCPEVRNREIGKWLIASGHARWPRGSPPAFELVRLKENHFRLV